MNNHINADFCETFMFEVKGTFKMGAHWQPFTKTVDVKTKDEAIERIFAVFGGNHGIARRHVKVESIEKAAEEKAK